jgi:hypothetical protein
MWNKLADGKLPHFAQKQENCRLQAKQQKLTFLKRRSFVRKCIKKAA